MSKIKVGINGFGRIGRMVTRAILAKYANEIEINEEKRMNCARTLR